MSNLLDLTDVQDSNLHPVGEFTATCIEAELKPTKNRLGKLIEVKLSTEKGFVWHMFNIFNDNPKAQEIGRSQLKQFLKHSGSDTTSFDMDNVSKLEGLKCNILVKHVNDPIYGDSAKITSFKPIKEVAQVTTQTNDIPF